MSRLKTRHLSQDEAGLDEAARLLKEGSLVAMPTETVYGLAADAANDRAVAAIYEAKGRPSFNPLIAHLASADAAAELTVFPNAARVLANAFWPGPLTLVLPIRPGAAISPLMTAGLNTLAVRVPAHPVAHDLLRRFGGAVAAPSANPSGRISPTTPDHVLQGLEGKIAAILDGGPCAVGVESTILAVDEEGKLRLLRPGSIGPEDIRARTGLTLQSPIGEDNRIEAPGQMGSHYAPRGTMRLNAETVQPGETMLGFGAVDCVVNLSTSGDLAEAAANLFTMMHRLDAMGAMRIAVSPIPMRGIGLAINDRLTRAAAPRT
ncbi:threonylcarbamoyl-AMP synthase [Pseudooceanicola sediminis]|uniref:Threonylcarbamoyl-AMP synthase n=1 Tax=Pseudooceanicola sediminis TaxID=2211117 RepID=A0A399J1Z3_9RHOB|nr:L-threonylcarbamoyladenylate synthase [Pseudooceanicola sediminis]KAA2314592.1 threonylcarbamoyl-AMP synthase [Puniceibacterium sp. HSS470]RII39453.1 threonylcarbamoyl-AMP synthase [Pseudooceanicola sediminis]|tara:strand:+ start:36576 stop:37535 length:960 start_codon:yes stop_codon:yes gene_type:complete